MVSSPHIIIVAIILQSVNMCSGCLAIMFPVLTKLSYLNIAYSAIGKLMYSSVCSPKNTKSV